MKFNEVMHLSFYTDQMDKMRDFYENKLGLKAKIIMRYGAYLGQKSRGAWAKKAITDPDGIAYIFIELAPGQYLELFNKADNQLEHEKPDVRLGYSHFALMVDDIFEARKELIEAGIEIDIEPNKGQKLGKCGFMIRMEINLKLCSILIYLCSIKEMLVK